MEDFGEWLGGSSMLPEVVLLLGDGREMKLRPDEVSVYKYITFITYKGAILELQHSENVSPQELINAIISSGVERIILKVRGGGRRFVLRALLVERREVRPVNFPPVNDRGATLLLPTPLGLLEVYGDSCDDIEVYLDGRFLKAEEAGRILNTLREEYGLNVCRILGVVLRGGFVFSI